MWGACSVGPVLKTQLLQRGLSSPLPIQERAFPPISKGSHAVIASPTGSGKTLAFLLPLLSATDRKRACSVLFVLPSTELAQQLRREVDSLCPPKLGRGEREGEEGEGSVMQVVTPAVLDGPPSGLLSCLEAPLVAGTPHALLRVAQAATKGGAHASLVSRYLKGVGCVVLDEADQLLDTASLAQSEKWRREQNRTLTSKERSALKRSHPPTPSERLLSLLPGGFSGGVGGGGTQLVCASASVSRTLRRQLQALVGASSVDKGPLLIAPPERRAKGDMRASLVPRTIRHSYALWKAEESDGRRNESALIGALWRAMRDLPPAAAIIFATRSMGVRQTTDELRALGLRRVVSLPLEDVPPESARPETSSDISGGSTWEESTIYVASERYARGLDLRLGYVFMMAPPASSASYMHLVGRTGRQGSEGTAVTLLTHRQVPRLVAFSEDLGIGFTPADGGLLEDVSKGPNRKM